MCMLRASVLIGIVFVLLFMLTACLEEGGLGADTITPGVEGAIYDGIIIFIEEPEESATFVQAEIRDLVMELPVLAHLRFHGTERLSFTSRNGYATIFVEVGDWVNEGDLLAHLSFESDELDIPRMMAEARLAQFDRDFALALMEREMQLGNARDRMYAASPQDFAAAYLTVQLQEIELEIFLRDRANARVPLFETLYEIDSVIAGENLYSPITGVIERTIHSGTFLRDTSSVVTVVDDTTFFFHVNIEGTTDLPSHVFRDSILRFGDTVTVYSEAFTIGEDGERKPVLEFDIMINIDFLARDVLGSGLTGPVTSNAMPVDIPAFVEAVLDVAPDLVNLPFSSTFRGSMRFYFASDTLMLPNRVLRRGYGGDYVLVYENGMFLQRHLNLGLSFLRYTEVLFGIDGDSLVVVPR